jgi:hypothetical protein
MSNTVAFSSTTVSRNISNTLFVVAGTLGFEGTNYFELSGPIKVVGGDFVLNSVNTANVTLSGPIIDGGGFFKTGTGTGLPPTTVVMYVGDNILDFPGISQEIRKQPDSAFASFGETNFIIPNPMYGSWEKNAD